MDKEDKIIMKKVVFMLSLLLVTACSEKLQYANNSCSAINDYHYHGGTVYFSGRLTASPDGQLPNGISLFGSNIFTDEDIAVEIPVSGDGTFAAEVHIPTAWISLCVRAIMRMTYTFLSVIR